MSSRELASDLIFDRFVDRDMYMRYAGGGVGHYKVKISDTRSTESSVPEEELEDFDVPRTETSDDSENGSSDADSGDEGDGADNDEGEDLPEDGEGGFVDAEDEEGYAPL